ncbi:GPP34 family phosphoprotein [Actinoplanes sp. NPDC051494]|uniref:GOLPH3/VPS74 family protein n=1 Tax=Actinoplanes sp. NPDC051494 TaxID=3363907 RepID=UPI00378CCAA9
MTTSLAEEIVLIAYRDDGRAQGTGVLDYGVGGAILQELALAGRIDAPGKKVVVTDPSPTGDPVADAALDRIAGDKARKPKDWVYKLGRKARPGVLDALVSAGVLERRKDRFLLIPYTRYPAPGGGEPPVETAMRDRLRTAVTSSLTIEPRTAALIALVGALSWRKQVFADLPKGPVRDRLKELRTSTWASEATYQAVQEMQSAVLLATT